MARSILVTGGAGFIGSHAVLRLLEDGHAVTVVDDLSRGNRAAMDLLHDFGDLVFVESGVGDRALLARLMRERSVDMVMHFAALAYVGESVHEPLRYYRANAADAIAVVEAMGDADVRRIVFSSTAAVYGEPPADAIPIREDSPRRPINPYGRSKSFVEDVLTDHAHAVREGGRDFACAMLRYFNVAGCDAKGRLGEDHVPETHLVPICIDTALGRRSSLTIFGSDYATEDGTCVRDYVHVEDLVDAHMRVMERLEPGDVRRYNVGIGRGYSVREVVESCRRVSGVDIAIEDGPRRAGDPPALFADPGRIERELGWRAQHTDLDEIVATAWRWRRAHPDGYGAS